MTAEKAGVNLEELKTGPVRKAPALSVLKPAVNPALNILNRFYCSSLFQAVLNRNMSVKRRFMFRLSSSYISLPFDQIWSARGRKRSADYCGVM